MAVSLPMARYEIPDRLVVAIGGNAIHPGEIRGTVSQQRDIAAQTGAALLPLMQRKNRLVITHGNGPVVGKILMRQALSRRRVAPMTLDICVAHSQGGIAYLLMQALENTLRKSGDPRHVVCLLTQVEVDSSDPAFRNPTKPIGFEFDAEDARAVEAEFGWAMREEQSGRYRHVVASPEPKHIADVSLIETVAETGAIIIAGGGGGIPVERAEDGTRRGLEAVIDKDLMSAYLANKLGYDTLVLLTEAPAVAVEFGRPGERWLDTVRAAELRRLQAKGHFPPGSMGPKVEAALRFVEGGGKRAIIGQLFQVMDVLEGNAGTHVVPG